MKKYNLNKVTIVAICLITTMPQVFSAKSWQSYKDFNTETIKQADLAKQSISGAIEAIKSAIDADGINKAIADLQKSFKAESLATSTYNINKTTKELRPRLATALSDIFAEIDLLAKTITEKPHDATKKVEFPDMKGDVYKELTKLKDTTLPAFIKIFTEKDLPQELQKKYDTSLSSLNILILQINEDVAGASQELVKRGVSEFGPAQITAILALIQNQLAGFKGSGGGLSYDKTFKYAEDANKKVSTFAEILSNKKVDQAKIEQIANIPTAIDELIAYSTSVTAGYPAPPTGAMSKAIYDTAISTGGSVAAAIAALSTATKTTLEEINKNSNLKNGLISVDDGNNDLSLGLKAIKNDVDVANGLKAIKNDVGVVNGLKAIADPTNIANIKTIADPANIANINTIATGTGLTDIKAALAAAAAAASTGGFNAAAITTAVAPLIAAESTKIDAKIAAEVARVDADIAAEVARVDAKITADIAAAIVNKADKTDLASAVAKLATKADVTTALAEITTAAKTIADAIIAAAK